MEDRKHIYWKLRSIAHIMFYTYVGILAALTIAIIEGSNNLDTLLEIFESIENNSISIVHHIAGSNVDKALIIVVTSLPYMLTIAATLGAIALYLFFDGFIGRLIAEVGKCTCNHYLDKHEDKQGNEYVHCNGTWLMWLLRRKCLCIKYVHKVRFE